MAKVLVLLSLIILLMAFLGMYEGINFLYYEESKADRYVHWGAVPLGLYSLITSFRDKYKYNIEANRINSSIKHSLTTVASFALLYLFLLTPVISGFILMTNQLFGTQKPELVRGYVIHKLESRISKGSEFELTVITNNKEITWDTNGVEIRKYGVGSPFQEQMIKGFWGLWYKMK